MRAGRTRRSWCRARGSRPRKSTRPGYFISAVQGPAANGMTARAVWFTAPYRVGIGEVALAKPKAGQVLVRAEFSGISAGTELLAYRGELDRSLPRDESLGALAGTFEYPFTYGYS